MIDFLRRPHPSARRGAAAAMVALGLGAAAPAQMPPGGMRPPEPVPAIASVMPVPHGEVRAVWYASAHYGGQRRLHVYLPPGYERGSARYPVLYLVHGGGGEDDSTWNGEGRIGLVLDNLLATGRIRPMIVVMPDGNGTDANMNRPGGTDTPEGLAARVVQAASTRNGFVADMLGGIVPYVDAAYRTRADGADRAVAGFSFGGTEALWTGTARPNLFGSIGIVSMGLQVGSHARPGPVAGAGTGSPADFVRDRRAFFANPAATNRQVKLFWIGVGKSDAIVVDGPRQLADTLDAHGIHHVYREVDGEHSLSTARLLVAEMLPLLFR